MTCSSNRVTGAKRLQWQYPLLINVVLLTTVTVLVLPLAACDRTSGAGLGADARHGMVDVYEQVQAVQYLSAITQDPPANSVSLSEQAYRPTGLYGDLSVGIGTDWQVHLVNVKTGEGRRLTGGLDRKRDAVISGSHVAWTSQSRLREVLSNIPLVRRSHHILVMDIESSVTRRITSGAAMRRNLQIDGSRLVWEESIRMDSDRYTDFDIYAYDIGTDERVPVSVAPGSQRYPAIDGDRVVWVDDRNCPEKKNGGRSPRSCPGGLLDVYLYDFTTGEETPVAKSAASAYTAPGVHGDYIVWRGHDGRYYENTTLHLHSLADGRTRTIASYDYANIGTPRVSEEYVLWTVREACDASRTSPRDMGTGAFVYGIEDGDSRQLTGYSEPDVLLDGKTAVIHEGCWFPGPAYPVILD